MCYIHYKGLQSSPLDSVPVANIISHYFLSKQYKSFLALQSSKRLNQSLMVLARILVSLKERDLSTWATASAGVYNLPTCHLGSWFPNVNSHRKKKQDNLEEQKFKLFKRKVIIRDYQAYVMTYELWHLLVHVLNYDLWLDTYMKYILSRYSFMARHL